VPYDSTIGYCIEVHACHCVIVLTVLFVLFQHILATNLGKRINIPKNDYLREHLATLYWITTIIRLYSECYLHIRIKYICAFFTKSLKSQCGQQ